MGEGRSRSRSNAWTASITLSTTESRVGAASTSAHDCAGGDGTWPAANTECAATRPATIAMLRVRIIIHLGSTNSCSRPAASRIVKDLASQRKREGHRDDGAYRAPVNLEWREHHGWQRVEHSLHEAHVSCAWYLQASYLHGAIRSDHEG